MITASEEVASGGDSSQSKEMSKPITKHIRIRMWLLTSQVEIYQKKLCCFQQCPTLLNELTFLRFLKYERKKPILFSYYIFCISVGSCNKSNSSRISQSIFTTQKAVFHAQRVNMHFDSTLSNIHHVVLSVTA